MKTLPSGDLVVVEELEYFNEESDFRVHLPVDSIMMAKHSWRSQTNTNKNNENRYNGSKYHFRVSVFDLHGSRYPQFVYIVAFYYLWL